MYQVLLSLHSILRWVVLIGLLVAIYRGTHGALTKKQFSNFDNKIRHYTATMAHLQLIVGLCLYFVSPVISYFLHHFKDALHLREIRFFGMEHSIMMVVAIVIITIGSMRTKRALEKKHQLMATWYAVALLIILISIPWPFSPMASRPFLRF